jgi:FixJ family two-component response regulator
MTQELHMSVQAWTIAVIDDDPRVLESLVNLLSSFGYYAQTYQSAEQFLKSGTLSRTSCIITDVEMRQMSGLGLLQFLKTATAQFSRNHHYGKAV